MAITRAAQARREKRDAAIAAQQRMVDGGRRRWAIDDPEAALVARRKAAAAVNSPAALARRLAKRWPEMSDDERTEVRLILASMGILAGLGLTDRKDEWR